MTPSPHDGDPAFADLLDELLDAFLNGNEPDLAEVALRHPAVAHRVDEAWELASGVAGRRHVRQPSLHGYRIVRELGRGGMGTVYLARQEQLDREVAIKVLPHSFGLSAHSRQRFLEEARALARVKHEHIVGIHRVVDDGEMLAFEMEFVDGPSLQSVLAHLRERRESGVVPTLQHVADLLQLPVAMLGAHNLTQFFVRIARQIGLALGAVHQAGFVHRDVKPANVLLRKNGQPVLADFGLVRDAELERTHKTGFSGTPVYSSPEQLRGNAPIGPSTDVYALAVTLYECLTLATPFAGRTTTDMLSRIENGRVPPLRRHAPHAPRDLETIVSHAMELEPERRYADGRAFAEDLQRLLDLQPILARPVGIARRTAKFLRRNRLPLLAGCIGAVLVAAMLLPLFNSVLAAERAADAVRGHLRSARRSLLALETHGSTWQTGAFGSASSANANPELQATSLQNAQREYAAALAMNADEPSARRELAVVRMVTWLRHLSLAHADSLQQAMASQDYHAIAGALPPVTRRIAGAIAAGTIAKLDMDATLAECTDAGDRRSLGLLAFLVGELRWCERAWTDLPPNPDDQALRDAGLGLLFLADGAPERAYVRLQSAQRDLPDGTLALELAEAALAMGETQLAGGWLAKVADDAETRSARLRVDADLQLALGDEDAATSVYRDLVAKNPLDPTPRHRLVQLAMRNGKLAWAADQLDHMLLQWPDMASLHLDRARVALQQRDVPAYLREVLVVLNADGTLHRAGGAAADLLEILRIGGLNTLHRQACADGHSQRSGRAFLGGEIPLRGLLPADLVDGLETELPMLANIQRHAHIVAAAGPELGDAASWLFFTAPLAMSRVPAFASQLTVPECIACELLPWAMNLLYPKLHADLRTMFVSLLPGSWSLVHLQPVQRPIDLAAAHVFGSALARGADWNNDGVDEMLVGCESNNTELAAGRVYVIDGRTASVIAMVEAPESAHMFGHSLALIGDVDGDGIADWLVGAPSGTHTARRGYANLYSGADRHLIASIEGDGAAFGVDCCPLGDIDGDGCPDFAIATPPIVRNATGQGKVTIYSGRTREVLRVLGNDVAGIWFGASIADAGDTDGDGVHDLIVGGNFGNAPGLVQLFSGRTGTVLHSWHDDTTTNNFGMVVTGPGDLDGDGFGDVTISAVRLDDHSGLDQVHVVSGRTGERITILLGQRPGARFGVSVARCNQRHGEPLLAVGAALGGTGTCGTIDYWTITGRQLTTLQGPVSYCGFGGFLAGCQDLDGDGRDEVFVACPLADRAGSVYRVDTGELRFAR